MDKNVCPKCGGNNWVTTTASDPYIDAYGNVWMCGKHTTTSCIKCNHKDTWVNGVYSSSNPDHRRFNNFYEDKPCVN